MRSDPAATPISPNLGLGLGLRSDHYAEVLSGKSSVSWFECTTENYMGDGGRPLQILEQVRRDRPIALHGVSMSLAGTDPLNQDYLQRLKLLVDRIQPAIVSDHCCWTGIGGENLHDLMPVPFTEDVVRHVVGRIQKVQDFLGRRILLENVSSYITFKHSEMTEWEFLAQICRRADCGLVLDVNNVFVSATNHGFNPLEFIRGIPVGRVGQLHLAGHSRTETPDGKLLLIDTHDHPVCPEVWDLYRQVLQRFGRVSTMVEWDAEIPDYATLEAELWKARTIEQEEELLVQKSNATPTIRDSGLAENGNHSAG